MTLDRLDLFKNANGDTFGSDVLSLALSFGVIGLLKSITQAMTTPDSHRRCKKRCRRLCLYLLPSFQVELPPMLAGNAVDNHP